MRSKARPATKEQKNRMMAIKEAGCLACKLLKPERYSYAEADHLKSGNRRIGHDHTIALCPWHHRMVPPEGMTFKQAREILGPSKAEGSKPFHARFGSEQFLLEMQRDLLEKNQSS